MLWSTALQNIDAKDASTIFCTNYNMKLSLPGLSKFLELEDHSFQIVAKTLLPPEFYMPYVESMIKEQHLPASNWLPGYLHSHLYNDRKLLFLLLHTARQMIHESDQSTISIAQLQQRVNIDERLFRLHILNLIEDCEGFVALDKEYTEVRLMTWQEALQASGKLISTIKPPEGFYYLPQAKLRLDGEHYNGSNWCLWQREDGSYKIMQFEGMYARFSGNEEAMDNFLKEYLPINGWAMAYHFMELKADNKVASEM